MLLEFEGGGALIAYFVDDFGEVGAIAESANSLDSFRPF